MALSRTTPRPPPGGPTNRTRDLLVLAGLFVLVLAGLGGLAAATGWRETMDQLAKLGPAQYAALLALSLVNYLFRAARWHLFTRALGLPLSFAENLRHYFAGFAMSVTPGRLGELIRMRWIRRETGWPFERTAPLMLVDRASDLASMALILAVAAALAAEGISGTVLVVIAALAASIAVTRPRILAWGAVTLYRWLGFWPRLFARIRAAARSLAAFSHPVVLLVSLVLGFCGWAAEGVAFHALLGFMGAQVDLWTALMIFTFATLAGGATGAPGGIGGAEAAMVGLLTLHHIPLEVAVPATAIIRVTTLWFALGIGLLVFPLAERHSFKVQNALEK